MPAELVALLSVVLAVVGVVGVVVPVLPGSIAVASGLLVWALFGGSPYGWFVFVAGAALVAVGATAQYLITGRTLKRREIPSRSVVVGLIAGVVGLFVIPFLGLPIGFVAGLLLMEYARVRELRQALATSWVALTSVGLGMLVELGCALAASAVLLVGVLTTLLG